MVILPFMVVAFVNYEVLLKSFYKIGRLLLDILGSFHDDSLAIE